ncbi:MAG: 50S ribosomal protein L18 [Conexivisphaera sp.]
MPIYRRRREGKTNYHRRRVVVASRKPFITVFVSNRNVSAQLHVARKSGDEVIAQANSRELIGHGWSASRKSTPAAYLVGYLLGLRALKAGVSEAVLYTGVRSFVPGSRVAAVVAGARDAGLNVAASEEVLPDQSRLRGEHIAEYARSLRESDPDLYARRFSGYARAGFDPSDYPRLVEDVKAKLREAVAG